MRVIISFQPPRGLVGGRTFRAGPYRSVYVDGDALGAFDGRDHLRVAYRVEGGWQVCGLEGGHLYELFAILPEIYHEELTSTAEADGDDA